MLGVTHRATNARSRHRNGSVEKSARVTGPPIAALSVSIVQVWAFEYVHLRIANFRPEVLHDALDREPIVRGMKG